MLARPADRAQVNVPELVGPGLRYGTPAAQTSLRRDPRCGAVARLLVPDASLLFEMNAWSRIAAAALGLLLVAPPTAAAAYKRPRPNEVPAAATTVAPNGVQLYNDYASPERTHSSQRVVVHYVVLGIDAPPLNDDDADGVPDYVEHVGEAADQALAYFERRGFRLPLPDEGGPDARPDVYVSRFTPGTLGVSFPAVRSERGPFAVVANNLDPAPSAASGVYTAPWRTSSFTSRSSRTSHRTVTRRSRRGSSRARPPRWSRACTPSSTTSSRRSSCESGSRRRRRACRRRVTALSCSGGSSTSRTEVPARVVTPLAARPVADEGERLVASTYASVTGRPFASAFMRFAVSVAANYGDRIEPAAGPRRGVPIRSPSGTSVSRAAVPG